MWQSKLIVPEENNYAVHFNNIAKNSLICFDGSHKGASAIKAGEHRWLLELYAKFVAINTY